ncbi:hypothetical protein GCM10027566_21510 [Arachidicoccus ginsenosidivorans]|jgi:hypothetical protein
MTHFYPSLFSFYLLGTNDGRLKRKQPTAACKNQQQPTVIQPARLLTSPLQTGRIHEEGAQSGNPVFSAQKQFLDLIEQLNLFTPCQATLKSILAYATGKPTMGDDKAAVDQHKDNHYDPKGTLSVCN